MTYRDRLETRQERREEWAQKASAKATQEFRHADRISERFAGGQPILIGHHSERGARADQERMHNAMDRGIERQDMAEHHASAASGIERMLKTSIFSDDANATEALEARIERREARAARMVEINKAYRAAYKVSQDIAKALAQLVTNNVLSFEDATRCAANMSADWRPLPKRAPFADYELTNLRGNIRRDKERLKEVAYRNEQSAKAEAAGGVVVTGTGDYCSVTFADKPDRDTINTLKASGFYWQGGSWHGQRAKLPEGVTL